MIGPYHQLFEIEKSFRMSRSDLQARPVYHHKCESIAAHLTIVLMDQPVCASIQRGGPSGGSPAPIAPA